MTNEYVFFGGKRVAMDTVSGGGGGTIGSTYYYAEDFLGSSRTMVQSGATSACFDADFLPFGREKDAVTTCNVNNYKFEGKERDAETGNDALFASRMVLRDDFGARYYSSNFGRWLSPDWSSTPAPVPYANLANPQTLNLYAMVEDDPESFADLDGHVNTPGTASQTGTCNVESWDGCDNLGQSRAWALRESAAGYTWQQIADIINGEAPAGAAYALTFTPRNISIPACLKDIAKCQEQERAAREKGARKQDANDLLGLLTLGFYHPFKPANQEEARGMHSEALSNSLAFFGLGMLDIPGEAAAVGQGLGNVAGGTTTAEIALAQGEKYLGSGYKEIAPGVYRSADGLRQFRMTASDLTDVRQGPHVHFESISPDGRTIIENSHVKISNP